MPTAENDLRVAHTKSVVEQTERLKSFGGTPPKEWSTGRCLEYLQQVTMLVGECYKADEDVVSAFVSAWARLHVIYTRRDEENRRRKLSRST